MDFLSVNLGDILVAFFSGILLAVCLSFVIGRFLFRKERDRAQDIMEQNTRLLLSKMDLEVANTERNISQVELDSTWTAQMKENERQGAMINRQNAEIERLQALNAELQAEQKMESVLDQRARNTQKEIDIRKTLIDAGVDPDKVSPPPPKKGGGGWVERNQFLFIFILGLIFIALFALLHIKGVI